MEINIETNYTLHLILAGISILIVGAINYYAWKSTSKNANKTFYQMCLNKKQKAEQAKKDKINESETIR